MQIESWENPKLIFYRDIIKSNKSTIIHHSAEDFAKRQTSDADKRIQFWIMSPIPPPAMLTHQIFALLPAPSCLLSHCIALTIKCSSSPNNPPPPDFDIISISHPTIWRSLGKQFHWVVIACHNWQVTPFSDFFMLFRISLFANFLFLFTQVISQVIRWTVLH